ncbi:MAG: zinc ribbon domain-containing protein [Acidobacteriia bacterium]|nr:zinc ribbon domain-containing protein [Terriglobia bacterium]
MFGPKGPFCQSCGMPLSKDEKGGTEADGRKSAEYCSHCYVRGAFTEPDITAQQMVEKVRGKMKEMHFPGFLANSFTRNIPSLKRWQKAASA